MSANDLPDELWRRILESGVRKSNFACKDLCCISISCRRLHRLSDEDFLWSNLLSSDFSQQLSYPPSSSSSSLKSIYQFRFEKERERKAAAHRRAVLWKESQIVEHRRKIREIETRLEGETGRMKETLDELSNLRKVRQASVALNVWQPEVVRGWQRNVIKQNVVPVQSRLHSIDMELKLCNQQIEALNKAYRDENKRLETAKEELEAMKYHPLREYKLTRAGDNECRMKRKKMKHAFSKNSPLTLKSISKWNKD